MSLATIISAAAIAWPLALGVALVDRIDGGASLASDVAYLAASRVCHQRRDRSFEAREIQWPVCARCAGLYLAGPLGVLVAAMPKRRRLRGSLWVVAAAALPTAATWGAEVMLGLPVSNGMRFVAALPLGAAVALVLVELSRHPTGIH